jgi:ribosomal protein L40E
MLCTKCNNDNPADASFCEGCGSKLELACPACKAPVNPGARFCKRCGTAIGAAKPDAHAAGSFSESQIKVAGDSGSASEAIDGERKTVTDAPQIRHRRHGPTIIVAALVRLVNGPPARSN